MTTTNNTTEYVAIIPTARDAELYPTFGIDIVTAGQVDDEGTVLTFMQPEQWIEGGEWPTDEDGNRDGLEIHAFRDSADRDMLDDLASAAGWEIDWSTLNHDGQFPEARAYRI